MTKGTLARILSLVVIGIAVLAGVVFYSRSTPEKIADMPIDVPAQLETLRAQHAQKITALEKNLQDDQKALLNKIADELEQLSRRVGVLERDLAARPLPGAIALARDMEMLARDVNGQISKLAQRISQPKESSFALLGLAMVELKRAASAGSDFSAALNVMKKILRGSLVLKSMTEYRSGVLSRPTLFYQFEIAAADARRMTLQDSAPVWSYVLRLVQVRPLVEIKGDGSFAVLSQLSGRVAEGDLSGALALEEKLRAHEGVYAPLASWFEAAGSRARLDRLVAALDAQVYQLLIESKPRARARARPRLMKDGRR